MEAKEKRQAISISLTKHEKMMLQEKASHCRRSFVWRHKNTRISKKTYRIRININKRNNEIVIIHY